MMIAPTSLSALDGLARRTAILGAVYARLTNHADLFFKPSKHTIQHELREKDLEEFEHDAGIQLPRSFVKLLRVQNGGYVRFNGVLGTTCGGEGDLYTLFRSIGGIGEHHSSLATQLADCRDWGAPGGLVPFDGDGHWWLCLDYRELKSGSEPTVVHFETEDGTTREIAPSFSDFLDRLVQSYPHVVLAVPKSPKKMVATLGCVPGRFGHAHTLDWPKFRDDLFEDGPATVAIGNNSKGGEPFFLEEAPNQTLLRVGVRREDADEAVRTLLEAFGPDARLVHQPPVPTSEQLW